MTKRVLIIAEAGVNHNGNIELAKQLIDKAAEAGVDYVKFQTFNSKKLVSRKADKAEYQKNNSGNQSESQLEMLERLELSKEQHYELISHCEKRKVKFLSTAFDLDSIDFLNDIDIDLFKIPSGEITNLPYLRKIATLGKPVILSTGMADLVEIKNALEVLITAGISIDNIIVLHCNTEYPTPMEDVNLTAMLTIQKEFGVRIGYSDHTLGIEIPTAAVAMGAEVIEKHFTLDKNLDGPDHRASLDPSELKSMVMSIRNIEKALGHGRKEPSKSELKNKPIARKSIVALTSIKNGDVFTEDNITVKRPGHGISPMEWDNIIGSRAKRDYQEDDLI